jgi:hypothetical protein
MTVYYEKHPVTQERKAELRAKGYKIVDAQFAPSDWIDPEAPKPVRRTRKVVDNVEERP